MNKQNHDIKDNFSLFQKLCSDEKIITDENIVLRDKTNNSRWLEGNSNCNFGSDITDLNIIVEKQKIDKKYHLKLRTSKLSKVPFFRFDSDGPAHRNYSEVIPLEEQKVTTPHFNSFDEKGFAIAYKNDILKDEEQAAIISNDINFVMTLFCQESNSKLKDDNYPKVYENEQKLDYDYDEMIDIDTLNFD